MSAKLSTIKHCNEYMLELTTTWKRIRFLYCDKCKKYFDMDMNEIEGMPQGNTSLSVVYDAAERKLS